MRAAAIVMPLPRRAAGSSLLGRTLETVLSERPCRVIIESSPDAKGSDGRVMMEKASGGRSQPAARP